VDIKGEGMVAMLLRRLFIPFRDNEHFVESNSSNFGEFFKRHSSIKSWK